MKCKIFFNLCVVWLSALVFFVACTKAPVPIPLGDAGQTLVKFINGFPDTANGKTFGYNLVNIDLVTTPQSFAVADIRRDVPNNAELNKTMKIVVKYDPGAASTYDSDLKPLPEGSYSVDPSTPVVGNDYEITMLPGEFSKEIKINLFNALGDLNLGTKYGMGFTISSVDADGKIASMEKTIVVEIGIKNKWDGVYKIEGDFVHPTACLVGPFFTDSTGGPREIELITIGTNSVKRNLGGRENLTVWDHCNLIGTYFTAVVPRYSIDPATNAVTVFDGPGSTVVWDNYGMSYDPVTKIFNLHYGYNGTRIINETFTYLRPR